MWSRWPFFLALFLRMVQYIITSWSKRCGNKLSCLKSSDLPPLVLWDWEIKKNISPIWILEPLHWCIVAKTFLHSLCVSDKCLISYWKRSRVTNCTDFSGTTEHLALKVPHLRKPPDKPIQWSTSLTIQDRYLFSACKGMPQHQHETLNGVSRRCRWVPTWIG